MLLQEGVASAAAIDAVAEKASGIGMGPLVSMNLTGPPIALHSTDYLAEQLHCQRYTGAANLRKMVEEGGMWDIGEDSECSDEAAAIIQQRLMGQVFVDLSSDCRGRNLFYGRC